MKYCIKNYMECEHFVQKTPDILPNTKGCQECEVEKTPWVAIRMCLTCGHVGCCDSSVGRHAPPTASITECPVSSKCFVACLPTDESQHPT